MKLLSLKLENFQGITEKEFEFNGRSASIYGDNATGKTTVFNALTWLLFDKASTGAKSFTPKPRDANGDVHNADSTVTAVFETGNGYVTTFRKVYREVYKKKRGAATAEFDGHTVDYTIDGVPAKEKEFAAAIQSECRGDAELMKMLTMPLYFPEQMSWEQRRRLLLEVCGDISDDEIIDANAELSELKGILAVPGGKAISAEDYKKKAAAQLTEINKQLRDIPSRIDEARRALPDTAGVAAWEMEQRREKLTADIEELTEKKRIMTAPGAEEIEAAKELAEAQAALDMAKIEYERKGAAKHAEMSAKISEAEREIRNIEQGVKYNEDRIKEEQATLERMKAAREALTAEYKAEAAKVWNDKDEICPTCGQALPRERIAELKAQFNKRKSERLTELNERGIRECGKDKIAEREQYIEQLKATAAQNRDAAYAKTGELKKLEEKINTTRVPFEITAEYAELTAKLAECRAKAEKPTTNTNSGLTALETAISGYRAELEKVKEALAQLAAAERQQRRIEELEQQEKSLAAEYEETEAKIYLCEQFIRAKVNALDENINAKFENVKFRLFKEQINGGLKEDCEVLVPGEGGRMIPFGFANNAARINAGLEIINALSKHFGVEMPVFVDNAEAVTRLAKSGTQVIRLVVSEQDKTLRLELN